MVDACPARNSNVGPDGHSVECVEQPHDSTAFYEHRCTDCGEVLLSLETEQEYLKWTEES